MLPKLTCNQTAKLFCQFFLLESCPNRFSKQWGFVVVVVGVGLFVCFVLFYIGLLCAGN